jgi:hypothetical protein
MFWHSLNAGANIKYKSKVANLNGLFFLFLKKAFFLSLYSIYFPKICSDYG